MTSHPARTRNWIDGHCHLADPRFGAGLEAVLERSRAAGIGAWVQGGVSPEDWDRQDSLQSRYSRDCVLITYGLHPWWVARASEAELQAGLLALADRLPQADGAGEMGLDLGPKGGGNLETQQRLFREQLKLAQAVGKPLVLHIVQAHTQALDILKEFAPFPAGGLVHSFSASKQVGARYLDLGLYLSVSGVVTKPGFQTLKKALNWVPLDRLVLETDAPDQPLAGTSGLNEPARLPEVAQAIAALRGETAEALLNASARNLRKLFGR